MKTSNEFAEVCKSVVYRSLKKAKKKHAHQWDVVSIYAWCKKKNCGEHIRSWYTRYEIEKLINNHERLKAKKK